MGEKRNSRRGEEGNGRDRPLLQIHGSAPEELLSRYSRIPKKVTCYSNALQYSADFDDVTHTSSPRPCCISVSFQFNFNCAESITWNCNDNKNGNGVLPVVHVQNGTHAAVRYYTTITTKVVKLPQTKTVLNWPPSLKTSENVLTDLRRGRYVPRYALIWLSTSDDVTSVVSVSSIAERRVVMATDRRT